MAAITACKTAVQLRLDHTSTLCFENLYGRLPDKRYGQARPGLPWIRRGQLRLVDGVWRRVWVAATGRLVHGDFWTSPLAEAWVLVNVMSKIHSQERRPRRQATMPNMGYYDGFVWVADEGCVLGQNLMRSWMQSLPVSPQLERYATRLAGDSVLFNVLGGSLDELLISELLRQKH